MFEPGEKQRDESVAVKEREDRNRKFGICVILTVESMATKIAGKTVELTDEEMERRIKQMTDAIFLWDQKHAEQVKPKEQNPFRRGFEERGLEDRFSNRWSAVGARMDKIATSNFIRGLREGESEVAKALKDAEI